MSWVGDVTFFSKEFVTYSGPDGCTSQLNWNLTKYNDSFFPFYFYECSVTDGNQKVSGYGISQNEGESLIKSFSEAWERNYFLKLQKHHPRFSPFLVQMVLQPGRQKSRRSNHRKMNLSKELFCLKLGRSSKVGEEFAQQI